MKKTKTPSINAWKMFGKIPKWFVNYLLSEMSLKRYNYLQLSLQQPA